MSNEEQKKNLKLILVGCPWLFERTGANPTEELTVIKLPSFEQLDKFVCGYMLNVDRCLNLTTETYDECEGLKENDITKFIKSITLLSLKYYPWQFHTTLQEDKRCDISWTEIDDWIPGKYKT